MARASFLSGNAPDERTRKRPVINGLYRKGLISGITIYLPQVAVSQGANGSWLATRPIPMPIGRRTGPLCPIGRAGVCSSYDVFFIFQRHRDTLLPPGGGKPLGATLVVSCKRGGGTGGVQLRDTAHPCTTSAWGTGSRGDAG